MAVIVGTGQAMLEDQRKPAKTSLDFLFLLLVYMTVVKSSDEIHPVPVMQNHKNTIKLDISLCVGLRNVLGKNKKKRNKETMRNKKDQYK